MLQEPVAGDESHDADRRRHAQGQADSQRRWKRPSIEIVHRAGDDQPADTAEETEGQHRPIPRLTMSHSNVDLVPYDQQEHRHEDVVGKRNCETDAKKLADDQSGPRDWLADDRQHRLVLDFPGQDTRGSECRQHDASEKQRAEPEIDEQFVVLSDRESSKILIEDHRQNANQNRHDVDRLTDRLEESIPGNGKNRRH